MHADGGMIDGADPASAHGVWGRWFGTAAPVLRLVLWPDGAVRRSFRCAVGRGPTPPLAGGGSAGNARATAAATATARRLPLEVRARRRVLLQRMADGARVDRGWA